MLTAVLESLPIPDDVEKENISSPISPTKSHILPLSLDTMRFDMENIRCGKDAIVLPIKKMDGKIAYYFKRWRPLSSQGIEEKQLASHLKVPLHMHERDDFIRIFEPSQFEIDYLVQMRLGMIKKENVLKRFLGEDVFPLTQFNIGIQRSDIEEQDNDFLLNKRRPELKFPDHRLYIIQKPVEGVSLDKFDLSVPDKRQKATLALKKMKERYNFMCECLDLINESLGGPHEPVFCNTMVGLDIFLFKKECTLSIEDFMKIVCNDSDKPSFPPRPLALYGIDNLMVSQNSRGEINFRLFDFDATPVWCDKKEGTFNFLLQALDEVAPGYCIEKSGLPDDIWKEQVRERLAIKFGVGV